MSDVGANLPLTQDIAFGTAYAVCCTSGVETSKIFSAGWSIATLITAAGASPSTIQRVTIERTRGAANITLRRPDFDPATPGGLDFPPSACTIATPPSGATGSCPAFIYLTGSGATQGLSFFRPERAPAPQDPNADDWIQSPLGAGLTIDIDGPHLAVTARADHTKVKARQAVHFTASATSPIAGEQLTYTWSFSDGTTGSGASVTHAFAHAGTYQAIARVEGSSGTGGASRPIEIVVDREPGAPGPGGGTKTTLPPTNGGDGGSAATQTTPTTAPPAPRSSEVPGAAVVPGGGKPSPTIRSTVTTPTSVAGRAAVGAALVRGELLVGAPSAVGVSVPALTPVKRATGAGGTDVGSHGRTWTGATVGVLAVLALYLFGAGSERRRRL